MDMETLYPLYFRDVFLFLIGLTHSKSLAEELIIDRDAAFTLHQCLHQLEEPYKEVFSLRVFGELSYAEIGKLFGRTANWACVTYHRAKGKIQEMLKT